MVQTESPVRESYEKISYDDLVTYVVYLLTAGNGTHTTFEDIVAKAFKLFPKRFSLRGYPQWPDSAVVNKSWLRSRTDKKYIVGSVKDGFRLTQRGLKVARHVEDKLQEEPAKGSHKLESELRTKSGRLLRSLERSALFVRYKRTGNLNHMEESDLFDVLLTMPDASPRRLSSNLEQFKDAATLYDHQDIHTFLAALEHKFSHKISTPSTASRR